MSSQAAIIQSSEKAISAHSGREIALLGVALAFVQILDGVLTGFGVHLYGTGVEGNLLLRTLMEQWGYIPALVSVKIFALSVICVLCILASTIPWLKSAMRAVILIYALAAILPWTAILLKHALV